MTAPGLGARRSTTAMSRSAHAWCRSPAGDARPVRGRDPGALAVRRDRGSSTSRTWGSSTSKARPRRAAAGASLQRPRAPRRRRGAVHAAHERARRHRRRPDRLPDRPVHYLLVVNAGNREAAYAWSRSARSAAPRYATHPTTTELLAVQGPTAIDVLGLPTRRLHACDGRGPRRRGDDLPHRLHG